MKSFFKRAKRLEKYGVITWQPQRFPVGRGHEFKERPVSLAVAVLLRIHAAGRRQRVEFNKGFAR